MRTLFPLLLAALSSACTMTASLSGRFDQGNNRFIGTITSDGTGTGPLLVRTQQGAECTGQYLSRKETSMGGGVIKCSDGREGTFTYNFRGPRGQGFGKMNDGDTFVFVFGPSQSEEAEAQAIAEGFRALGQSLQRPPPPIILPSVFPVVIPPAPRTFDTTCYRTSSGVVQCQTR